MSGTDPGWHEDWRRFVRRLGWPIQYFSAHPSYLQLWLFMVGAGVLCSAARIAIVVHLVGPAPLGMTTAYFVLLEGVAACVFAPLSGSLIDRTSPLTCLRIVEAAQIVALLAFVAVPGLPALIVLVPVLGGLSILYQAARDAALLDTVPREAVARASGLDQAAAAIALMAGPAIGTLLAASQDLRTGLAILAGLHLLLLLLVCRIRTMENPERRSPDAAWVPFAAWRSLDRVAVLLLVVFAAGATIGALWLAVAPAIITHSVGASGVWLGPQAMLAGVACILGGLIAPVFIERYGPVGVMMAMALAESAAAAVYSLSPTLATSNMAIALLGFFAGGCGAAFYARFQNAVELSARGRVFALIRQIDAATVLLAGALAALCVGLPGWLLLLSVALVYAGCTITVALRSFDRSAMAASADVVTRTGP
ncbi:MFS transporter [Bradyrhizobium liaoningense]|uniref:MFS transporter n=1 Tax=Bradyrhizobium liaoningense TaxID=43992 RepID=UPI001BAC9676|nr:MFS transporter [Bradyrhizobium liaoningense]MBR1031480.1 MFS transporter [Bradyrhizobium liaoningense]